MQHDVSGRKPKIKAAAMLALAFTLGALSLAGPARAGAEVQVGGSSQLTHSVGCVGEEGGPLAADCGALPAFGLSSSNQAQLSSALDGAEAAGQAAAPAVTPTVTGVSPKAGPEAGGTSVTVTGTGFITGASVKFGSEAASNVTVNSETSITATSPKGKGTVDVTVTTSGGTSATGE
ncbi:MAG: IPT/TIG domain-containing protein, partial [Solirubrobacteraceae bacterium]